MDTGKGLDGRDPTSAEATLADAASNSAASSPVFGSDDTRRNTSSSDMSSSSSSGEYIIPASAAVVVQEAPVGKEGGEGRGKCVGRSKRVTWGSASSVGRRKEMEDAHAVVPGFMSSTCEAVGGCKAPGSKTSSEISPVHFFGVYDGHGGSQVARFCAEQIHVAVAEEWEKGGRSVDCWNRRWEEAFSTGFKNIDNDVGEEPVAPDTVGSTAVTIVVSSCQIIASNCGDSRAVLCRGTQTIQITSDHKPDREDELARIEGQGGKVINWNGPRVFGVLTMSRAIGDRYLKPWVTPVPEITFTTRTEEDEFLIIASDGLWDVMTNEEVGNLTRKLLRELRRVPPENGKPPAQAVAEHLVELAYHKNSCDNITVIVVDLKPRRKRL